MGLSDIVYPESNWDQTANYSPCTKAVLAEPPECVEEARGFCWELWIMPPEIGVLIPLCHVKGLGSQASCCIPQTSPVCVVRTPARQVYGNSENHVTQGPACSRCSVKRSFFKTFFSDRKQGVRFHLLSSLAVTFWLSDPLSPSRWCRQGSVAVSRRKSRKLLASLSSRGVTAAATALFPEVEVRCTALPLLASGFPAHSRCETSLGRAPPPNYRCLVLQLLCAGVSAASLWPGLGGGLPVSVCLDACVQLALSASQMKELAWQWSDCVFPCNRLFPPSQTSLGRNSWIS